ncbi:MAG: site-specific DNA-methyltransferase, partial [Bacteroidales bacterium]|nr:site-specific DNA-methyltransferase [Bacteroidales bacterium]
MHPAPFPFDLAYRILKFYTYKNDLILDMFGGTGTVALACSKTQRRYIYIDISKKYTKYA